MTIYTRTGDAGTTALFSGQRVSKTHPRVEAYGTLDELNAALSLCVCATHHPQHRRFLESVQQQIFWFSAELASESEQPNPGQRYISTEEIAVLEATIDAAMSRVAVVHSFILPGRCEAASRLHFARTLIEDLTTTALTGDGGMVLFEYSPFGVIGSVAPSTNPTETIINNSISMLAAGNSVYFSPHPGAKSVSLKLIGMIEEIAFRCCGIRNLLVTVAEPTFEATQQMMSHPDIAVLAITGGPGIVAMGMKSGKKVIGAGAGNPPCIVDETADLVKAAEDIINGAAFDYNLPCIAEKSLIVVESVAERLIQQMQAFGALLLSPSDTDKLRTVCLQDGHANKKLVGKSPATLLEASGIATPAKTPRLLIAVVNAEDPWVTCEQLMPMLPIVKVSDFDSALALALKVEAGLHHTAIMHSENVSRLNLAVRTLQTSIFVKNGPSYAGIGVGGEGFTTFTIATPTGEGTTSARTFARSRRCVLTNGFSIR